MKTFAASAAQSAQPAASAQPNLDRLDRRAFVKTAALAGAGAVLSPALARALTENQATAAPTQPNSKRPPNILMIAIDDLRAWPKYIDLGNQQALTPNLDRLAAMGMPCMNAYCCAPVCNPSRTALLTGMRPTTTGVYDGEDWRKNPITNSVPTLTSWLRQNGYLALGAGKVYHDAYRRDLPDWDGYGGDKGDGAVRIKGVARGVDSILFRPLDCADSEMPDYNSVEYCIDQLQRTHDKPLLLACGFHKPHTRWEVPRKYFDKFPLDQIQLPKVQPSIDDLPPEGKTIARNRGIQAGMVKQGIWKDAIQAYLAAMNFMDTQLGRLLDAFEKSPYRDNTIILLWTDHGYHHGEKEHWAKFAVWEETTRVPVMWIVPGVTKPGVPLRRVVEHMSIYPTLCDVVGIPKPPHLEGTSYYELLKNPDAPWDRPAITTYRGIHHGVRTQKWRYIRYAQGGEELYDHDTDPLEWKNLANDPQYAAIKADLRKMIPKTNPKIATLDRDKKQNRADKKESKQQTRQGKKAAPAAQPAPADADKS